MSYLKLHAGGFPYEAIFISPRVYSSPPPLAIFVHGGPHMVCCARFNVWNACLVSLGYSVMLGKERERAERVCRQKGSLNYS